MKRDRLQIIYDILSVISNRNGKVKPTHILFKANLSHRMMEEYLNDLIAGGFILRTENKSYELTPKGFEYLAKYASIKEFLQTFGLDEE